MDGRSMTFLQLVQTVIKNAQLTIPVQILLSFSFNLHIFRGKESLASHCYS